LVRREGILQVGATTLSLMTQCLITSSIIMLNSMDKWL
jgi:hypothetical protein